MTKQNQGLLYGLGVIAGFMIGLISGTTLLENGLRNGSVYVKDLNKDGIQDVVTKSKAGTTFVYLGQEDGTFKPLKQVKDYLGNKIKEIEKNAKNDLGNKIEEIEKNAKKIGIE